MQIRKTRGFLIPLITGCLLLPTASRAVAQEYDPDETNVQKFIVMKRGLASEVGADREFTDWNALDGFVHDFLEMAES